MKDPRHHPAFPTDHHVHAEGMTLRDWFAGQALPALIALRALEQGDMTVQIALTEEAYDIADTMLEQRDQ